MGNAISFNEKGLKLHFFDRQATTIKHGDVEKENSDKKNS